MSRFTRTNYKIYFKSKGEPMLWLTGGGMLVALLMIIFLIYFIVRNGIANFWPDPISYFETVQGEKFMGEVTKRERYVIQSSADKDEKVYGVRYLVRIGNFELTNEHFKWLKDSEIVKESKPKDAMVLERLEWGRFYGFPYKFKIGDEVIADNIDGILKNYDKYHDEMRRLWKQKVNIEKKQIGKLNHLIEKERLKYRKVELKLKKAKLS